MAVKKNKKDTPLQGIEVDPVVETYLAQGRQAEVNAQVGKELKLTEYKRRKRKFDKARVKATYDLPKKVKESIEEIAEQEGVPVSHLAALFLHHAVQMYKAGGFALNPYKAISRHPAFRYSLVLNQDSWEDTEDKWSA